VRGPSNLAGEGELSDLRRLAALGVRRFTAGEVKVRELDWRAKATLRSFGDRGMARLDGAGRFFLG
jgi:hypothetical protein